MSKIYLYLLFFVINFNEVCGQILINNSISNVDGDTLSIKNVGNLGDSSTLANLKQTRNNTPIFLTGVLINDTLNASFDTALFTIENGLVLMLTSDLANSNQVVIKLNSTCYQVSKANNNSLVKDDIIPQKIMILAYSQNKFIYLNPERSLCPSGYSKVNEKYCIETNERQADFWSAMTTCLSEGARLCSWSEWYYACRHSAALGIVNMYNLNWEWVHQSQNEVYQGKAVGRGRCDITIHRNGTQLDFFRCCFDY